MLIAWMYAWPSETIARARMELVIAVEMGYMGELSEEREREVKPCIDWQRSAAKTDRDPSPMKTKSAPTTDHAGRTQVSATDTHSRFVAHRSPRQTHLRRVLHEGASFARCRGISRGGPGRRVPGERGAPAARVSATGDDFLHGGAAALPTPPPPVALILWPLRRRRDSARGAHTRAIGTFPCLSLNPPQPPYCRPSFSRA